jgi:hypothetical protein
MCVKNIDNIIYKKYKRLYFSLEVILDHNINIIKTIVRGKEVTRLKKCKSWLLYFL